MRIISGEFRRRLLATPKDDSVTRPIPDRVKESLFSLLRGHFEEATVFDGFAGTGAIGLEAVSRGASRCVFVERDREIVKILRANIESLGCGDRCDVITGDVLGAGALASAPRPLKLAFLDPPYPLMQEPIAFRRVMAQAQQLINLLLPDGYLILRTPWPLRHTVIDPLPVDPNAPTIESVASPVPPAAEPVREMSRKDKRGMVKRGRSWRRYAEALDPRRADELVTGRRPRKGEAGDAAKEISDQIDSQLAAAEAKLSLAARTHHIEVDLKIPNALGPETHAFKSMAVHLYIKKPA